MYNVFKVTAATVKSTQKGYKLFNLQLNKDLWVTKLFPLRKVDQITDSLYKQYTKNDNNLDFITGRYIAIELKETKFGMNFGHIESFDVIFDFKKLLDSYNGKGFQTRINIFDFLKDNGYPVNADNSITLKAPYSQLNIRLHCGTTVCYPNKPAEGTLTLENIELIYDNFYKDKYIDNGNPDRDEQYSATSVAIIVNRKIYHKSLSKTLSNDSFEILKVGDKLSEEQCQFLAKQALHKQSED